MAEVIAFPDAEALAVNYLRASLGVRGDVASVGTKAPGPRIGRHVRVSRAGGSQRNEVYDAPLMIFECWDATEVAASTLCRLVRALIGALPGEHVGPDWVADFTEAGGPVNFPDESPNYRYQFSGVLLVRGYPI